MFAYLALTCMIIITSVSGSTVLLPIIGGIGTLSLGSCLYIKKDNGFIGSMVLAVYSLFAYILLSGPKQY